LLRLNVEARTEGECQSHVAEVTELIAELSHVTGGAGSARA